MKNIFLVAALCALSSCNQEVKKPTAEAVETVQESTPKKELQPEVAALVAAHGMNHWDTVEEINFTFNVDRGGENVASRSWSWKPKTDDVIMTTATDTLSYNRNDMESEAVKADQGFINDKYWLLAPFQIAWDEGTTVISETAVEAPMSKKNMNKLTLTYGNEGGYTPGDAYDFYYENPNRIEEWVFRKGNANEASMTTTFEGYKEMNGMQIATEHKNEDGSFRLYFTDVSIKTAD